MRRRVVKGTLGIVIGVVTMYVLLQQVNPTVILAEAANVNTPKLLVAVALIVSSYLLRTALATTLLGRGNNYSYWAVFRSMMIGYLANNLLPARLGDVTRATWLHRWHGGSYGRVLGSVALERAMDVTMVVVLLIVSLDQLRLRDRWLVDSALIWGAGAVTAVAGIGLLRWVMRRQSSILVRIVAVVDRLSRHRVLHSVRVGVADFIGAVSLANAIRGLAWALLMWLVTCGGLYFTLDALGLTRVLGLTHVLIILSVATLGLAVPSLPAGLGAYEAAFVFGATLVGLPEASGLSAALLYHALWILVTSALGLLSIWWEGRAVGELFGRAGQVRATP